MQEQTSQRVGPGFAGRRYALRARVRELVNGQPWLNPASRSIQRAVDGMLKKAGAPVADALHGTWLGHALHPALTDVPLGAWTVATTLDLVDLGSERASLTRGADAALAVGIAAAVPTAVTGIADWTYVDGFPRRLGLVHAGLNTAGLLLNVTSLVLRLRGNRRPAVACSSVAYLAASLAAWVGGELVYQQGIAVDRTTFQDRPKDFVPVMPEHELAEGRPRRVMANNVPVLLFRKGAEVYAIGETCSHQGGPLAEGEVHDGVVTCPWHGSQFRLEDGTLVHGPSTFNQPKYSVRVRDGQIEVRHAI